MSNPNRRNGVAASLASAVAVVALIGASSVVAQAQTPATPAPTQTAPTRPTATNPAQDKAIEQRITQLHAELKITPEQESKWSSVAQAMRDNAANIEKVASQSRQPGTPNMTAIDDLEANQQFVQAHLDGLKNFTSAFKSLYDSMPEQQKKNADQVFAKMNQAPQKGGANHSG